MTMTKPVSRLPRSKPFRSYRAINEGAPAQRCDPERFPSELTRLLDRPLNDAFQLLWPGWCERLRPVAGCGRHLVTCTLARAST